MKDLAKHLTQTCHMWAAPILVVSIIALCLIVSQTAAQTISAAITGRAIDQSQGAIPNAVVQLTEELTGVMAATHTSSTGDFIFTNIQPGTYSITVSAPGYKELRKVHLTLSAAQNLSAGAFILAVGSETQTITVEGDITPLQTDSAERSDVLDTKQIDNLLSLGRDAMAMTKVMPGVVENTEGYSSLSQSTIPVANGVNNEYALATTDGVVSNTRGLNQLDTPLNLDAVKEITINESNYQAQYGSTAGAQVNIVTKNGTRNFHGGLYEYFRNTALNANSFFNKFGTNIPRPVYRYNTFGGTLGGPIYWKQKFNKDRNKLFFFVSIEDSPIKSPEGLKYYTVPTELQAAGDFSQTYNQGTTTQNASTRINIAMPGNTATCPVNSATPGTGCFPGNVVSSGTINPQGQILLRTIYNNTLKSHPELAFTNLAVSDNNYNFVTNYSANKPVHQEVFRIDYAHSDRLHAFFRGELATVNDDGHSSPANYVPWLMSINYQNSQPNYALNITYTITPTLVNELNIGTAGFKESQLYNAEDFAKVTTTAVGLNVPSLASGVNPLNLFPATSFGGVSNAANFTWDYRFPMLDQVRTYNIWDNLTKVINNHTIKAGVDLNKDYYLQVAHNRVSTLTFNHDTSNPYDSNFAYANAVLGNMDNYQAYTSMANFAPGIKSVEWYYQDTWKVKNNFTLDYGMRNSYAMEETIGAGNNFLPELYKSNQAPTLYQYSPDGKNAIDPLTGNSYPRAYAGMYIPNTGNTNNGILYANTPGYPSGGVYSNGLIWAPRIGLAWSLNNKTVIRGGYGMTYNVRMRAGQQGDFTLNAPTTNTVTEYYSSLNSAANNYYLNVGTLSGPYGIAHAIELHPKIPYAEQTSLGVQRELPSGIVLDVAYVGTFTKHASGMPQINEVPYNSEFLPQHQINPSVYGSGILPDNFYRPYPGLSSINIQRFNLTANYNALQAKLTRRFHSGLEYGVAYTFSKAMDYVDAYNGNVAVYQDLRKWNYGPAGWDHRHMLVVNYLWNIPRGSHAFGSDAMWNNVVTRYALDKWTISGFATYYSGAPASLGLGLSNGQNVTGGGDGARVVLTCDPGKKVPHVTRTFRQWFNTGCVQAPLAGSVPTAANPNGTTYSTGMGQFARKVSFYLPGDTNFDTALLKDFPVARELKLQLRVETYNTFNHTEFNGVNSTATFANANLQGAGNPQTAATFGQLTSTQSPRYMQIALRLDF